MISWSKSEIAMLRELVLHKEHQDIALMLGKTKNAVRTKCHRLGIRKKAKEWTKDELIAINEAYASGGYVDTVEFAKKIGRSVTAINLKVSRLGYGNASRPLVEKRKVREPMFSSDEERAKFTSKRVKAWIKENGHPRGALGMKHSEQTKAVISLKSRTSAANRTDEQKAAMVMKQMKTRVKNGTDVFQRSNASWKSGWREIGGVRKYYRSKWEANYAHYLQWLLENKQIKEWLHEPVTFWFEGVKRGCVSYLPDFWILENDGSESYHEVKGWMDDRSKTKIRRMAKYHPTVKLVVIDSSGYNALKKSVKGLVPGWED